MSLESWAYVAEIVGAIAVVASLIYVGLQIRDSNRVTQANARHNISEFVLQISMFNAEHSERIAEIQDKVDNAVALTSSEQVFQWYSHMNIMLHAETYFHHHELGLMQSGHWKGYVRYIEGYAVSPGLVDFWRDVGPAFSRNFSNWMTEIINRKNDSNLPSHDEV